LLSVDLVKRVIGNSFNRYFSCRCLVDCVIAEQSGVSLWYVMARKKRYDAKFEKYRRSMCVKVGYVLKQLEAVGYIEKYNRKVWRVV